MKLLDVRSIILTIINYEVCVYVTMNLLSCIVVYNIMKYRSHSPRHQYSHTQSLVHIVEL